MNEKMSISAKDMSIFNDNLVNYIKDDGTISEDAPMSVKMLQSAITLKIIDYIYEVMGNYIRTTRPIDLSVSDLVDVIKTSLDKFYVKNAATDLMKIAENEKAIAEARIAELEELKEKLKNE